MSERNDRIDNQQSPTASFNDEELSVEELEEVAGGSEFSPNNCPNTNCFASCGGSVAAGDS